MAEILGWGTAGGFGIFLAGVGVFFWGISKLPRRSWPKREK